MEKITRRTVLTGTSVVALAVAAPVIAKTVPVDPHVAWEVELNAIRARSQQLWRHVSSLCARIPKDLEGEKRGKAMDRLGVYDAEEIASDIDIEAVNVEERIAETPARTIAGLMVQVRLMQHLMRDEAYTTERHVCDNVAAAVTRMLGGAA